MKQGLALWVTYELFALLPYYKNVRAMNRVLFSSPKIAGKQIYNLVPARREDER